MGFDEGSIILNSENETYFAGQTIFGKLVFQQDKVKTFRGLYVKMKGFCKVHWTTSHTEEVNNRRHTRTENHDSYEEYFSRKVFLLGGESGEYHLQPGKHELPFDCPIPANCPSSFEGKYGHVRYEIKVVVDRAFKLDQEKKKQIRVIAPLDLNFDPYCKEPMQFDIEDTYCCCCMGSGSSATVVKLPVSGYCPGQTIPIELSCSNQGGVEIERILMAIQKRITYHAVNVPDTKHEESTVLEMKKGPVPGESTRSWMVDMEVPAIDVYNMGPCRFIDIEYDFKVTVVPEGCHSNSEDRRSIRIGTVPLMGYQDNIPNPLQDQMPQVMPIMNQPPPTVRPFTNSYPNQNSPYPNQNTHYTSPNPPYPVPNPSPYPNNTPQTNQPSYPGMNQPYPVPNGQNPPYPVVSPTQNTPNPGNYPQISPRVSPYPDRANSPMLKTGTIGFTVPNVPVPSLPPGINVPYPLTPPNNPYATASAPEPATPDDGQKSPLVPKEPTVMPYPPYNPEYMDKMEQNK
ncbi:arrestin domain-containing protein 17 [Papilio machaon]|uniref:arrestin domain-containing protein 17 n=1 Tax=Papilio machaon TaxID=76193 RepID=UPI001E662E2C|nr:arrestin domain-containing protein 17 [Papilio machaon]